jgi:ABC-type Fe3+-hydroxamate transport system substrate-binding protein
MPRIIARALPLTVAIAALAAASASAQAGPTVTEIDIPSGPRIRIVETAKPKTKTVLIDWTKDGKWDVGVVDTDGNGFMDMRWVDGNGDGKPQRRELTPIPEPDPDKICAAEPDQSRSAMRLLRRTSSATATPTRNAG